MPSPQQAHKTQQVRQIINKIEEQQQARMEEANDLGIRRAAANGHLDIVEWFAARAARFEREEEEENDLALRMAAAAPRNLFELFPLLAAQGDWIAEHN
jgi:hypothetical protein